GQRAGPVFARDVVKDVRQRTGQVFRLLYALDQQGERLVPAARLDVIDEVDGAQVPRIGGPTIKSIRGHRDHLGGLDAVSDIRNQAQVRRFRIDFYDFSGQKPFPQTRKPSSQRRRPAEEHAGAVRETTKNKPAWAENLEQDFLICRPDQYDGRRMTAQSDAPNRLRRVTSRQNALVKELRRAFTQDEAGEGAIGVEGVRLVEEAIRSGLRFQAVFFSDAGEAHAQRLLPQIASQVEVLSLPDDVFAGAVSTETPQGVAALVKLRPAKLEEVLEQLDSGPLLVGAAGIQDPGNLGTMIRSAEAFGARAVLVGEKTVNHFNPKVVRASAGSLFRQPILRVKL